MANGHGGARKGAGRKPKPLCQKIAEGNPGHRPLKKVAFDGSAQAPVEAPEYLRMMAAPIAGIPRPAEIFESTVRYLEPSGCLPLIPTEVLTDYCVAKHCLFLAQHELAISSIINLKKGTKDEFEITTFTECMLKLQKNAIATWQPIWDIVSRNSTRTLSNPADTLMEDIVAARARRKTGGAENG